MAGQPLGPAKPPADVRLTRTADAVKLSSKLFLLSADDTLHALASTAFMRMLRQEDLARVPDFAGQRVRQVAADNYLERRIAASELLLVLTCCLT